MENLDFSEEEIQEQLAILGYKNIPKHRLCKFKQGSSERYIFLLFLTTRGITVLQIHSFCLNLQKFETLTLLPMNVHLT